MHGLKTIKELYVIADNWRNRSHRLRDIWQDTNRDPKERSKAHLIWWKLVKRILNTLHAISEYHQRTNSHNFNIGGMFVGKFHLESE